MGLTEDMQPDAYGTDISLYALDVAGVPATHDAYTQGVRYLMRNQYQDGSWLVRTRSYPTQTYFESGYPFGNNQFLSAGAATWSALAMLTRCPIPPCVDCSERSASTSRQSSRKVGVSDAC
jgi:hypothetical protein